MVKITILGSCRHGPYEILATPTPLNHEGAIKKFQVAIDNSDFILVYAPDGIGENTQIDLDYAKYMCVDFVIFPEDAINSHLYQGLGVDLRNLRDECDLTSLSRTVDMLKGQEKDSTRLRIGYEREIRRLKTAISKIEKQFIRWKRLAGEESVIKEIGAIVENLNL